MALLYVRIGLLYFCFGLLRFALVLFYVAPLGVALLFFLPLALDLVSLFCISFVQHLGSTQGFI